MKHVSIVIPHEAVPASIVDPRYMFTAVNQFLKSADKPALFTIELVGLTKDVSLANGSVSIHVDKLLKDAGKTDLIIIPALSGDLKTALKQNDAFIPWIQQQYSRGAELASLCIGAFLLASTGLLNGKKCSTHWLYVNEFREMFPEVELVDDKIISEEQGIYSSGGASSYWNLLLHLVEKYTNREMAIMASKFFALDIERNSQSSFVIFKGQKSHDDDLIKLAQDYIENNFHDRISVDQIIDKFAIGRRSFERRFKKATHNTVIEYIQRVKIEAAKRSFESNRKTVNEVMYDVGYTDTKSFRDVFRKVTGMSPVDYRNKYKKEPGGNN